MKLWEVLKELEENPKKVFRSGIGHDIEHGITLEGGYYFYGRYKDGQLIEKYPDANGFNGNANIDQDWQEVRQSIPWQKALDAWSNGITLTLEIGGETIPFRGKSSICITRDCLTNGTWFIGEEI